MSVFFFLHSSLEDDGAKLSKRETEDEGGVMEPKRYATTWMKNENLMIHF